MLSIVPSSNTPPPHNTILQQIAQDETVRGAIRAAIEDAATVAEADKGPHQLRMQNSILFSFKSIEFLGTYLVGDLGWEREEIDNHARFYSPPGQFTKNIRLIFCQARHFMAGNDHHFRARARGVRWKELVNENRVQLQLEGLDASLLDESVRTICVFATNEDGILTVYLADPVDVIKQGTKSILLCSDAIRILFGVPNHNTPNIGEDSSDTDLDIEELDDEATGS